MYSPSIFIPAFELIQRTIYNLPEKKKNVCVIGYGWGGKAFCDTIDKRYYNVTVINKSDKFVCTPKLIRINEYEKAIIPIQEKNLIIDEVVNVDDKEITVTTKNNGMKHFDYLVVATGSKVNTFNIKGADTCQPYKTVEDVINVKKSLDTNTNYQIIGAGPSGIEVAFELTNMNKSVTLIEAADKILPNFSDSVRDKVIQKLKEKNVELLLNHKVISIDNSLINTNKHSITRHYTLWMSGVQPLPLVSNINKVNEYLQYNNSIYVIGDSIRGYGPPTAQNATQQGYYLGHHFNNSFKSEPYKFIERGKILHTSDTILIDYNNECYEVPKLFRPIIDYFVY